MAEYSLFWGGVSTGDAAQGAGLGAPYTDQAYADYIAALFNYDRTKQGVVLTRNPVYEDLFFATWSDLTTLTVGPGMAVVDGTLYLSTEAEVFNLSTTGWYQVVLRKDFAAQTVRMIFRTGTTVTQTDGTAWEIELWRFYYEANGFDSEFRKYDKRGFIQGSNGGIFKLDEVIIGYDRGTEGNSLCQFSVSGLDSGQPFKALEIHYEGVVGSETASGTEAHTRLTIRFNNDATATNYKYRWIVTPYVGAESGNGTNTGESAGVAGLVGLNGNLGSGKIYIPYYAGDNSRRTWMGEGVVVCSSAANSLLFRGGGQWDWPSEITTITLESYNTLTGFFEFGRFYLYGWV